jgi:hypothetical protein
MNTSMLVAGMTIGLAAIVLTGMSVRPTTLAPAATAARRPLIGDSP